ncbi:hypothetical protein GCM10007898_19240 [Dyella flagellata]|uniref:Uncharacterized protein n=1 Tax=Dyella flagellata TaxID=1867833 RepID=A0ABQ5X9T2_9GAMM|nr:hypothetical protein GCM10007898_19240 [Dyella flagellata]
MCRPQLLRKTGPFADAVSERVVIPAKAGIHGKYEAWIPAFAGMTRKIIGSTTAISFEDGLEQKSVGILGFWDQCEVPLVAGLLPPISEFVVSRFFFIECL